MRTPTVSLGALLAAVLAAGPPSAHAAAPSPCPGDPIQADRVITGTFASELQGSHVQLPVEVPAGTTAVRVKYCYDQPESGTESHTLDLGLYEARRDPSRPWGLDEFRGWGGSSHPDVTVSPEGFMSDALYRENPRAHVPGKTSRAFLPGPIAAGRWAVELGVAAVVPRTAGDADGAVAWRVEVAFADDPQFADEPYRPARYDDSPARRERRWYAGDMHVHSEHSDLGAAPMEEVFEYAFRPLEKGGAGLDFIALSDYVSGSAWGEIGRHQERYPGRLIMRSAEVITYRGHVNNHVSVAQSDYRTGRVHVRRDDGSLELVRSPRPASDILERIHQKGGFTQINHPTIFPSDVPALARFCRGCPWDYGPAETDYGKVDAIEVATGPPGLRAGPRPGPNPFTVTAIDFWERALDRGHKIAAVGSSDSHHAGRTPNPVTQAPIGTATTMVFADELSEEGIERAVRAGHTYVKVFGAGAPDLRLEARVPGPAASAASQAPAAIMGDTVRAAAAELTARVIGGAPEPDPSSPEPYQLLVVKDGTPMRAAPVTSDDFSLSFMAREPGRYRLQLQRGTAIEGLTSPIYLEPASSGDPAAAEPPRAEPEARRATGAPPGGARSPQPRQGRRPAPAAGVEAGSLPFTGAQLGAAALLGTALLGAGLALRRGRR